tara:strand:- start:1473 stop:2933 length:1461 start_codon:yes stop_codon:yes gene_type:complete
MTLAAPTLASFSLYMLCLIGIGLWHSRQSNQSVEDYILGGRKMGPTVTALSVNASDMSSWLLLALPGTIYLNGIHQAFIGIGLIVGAWLNWTLIAKRLRIYTQLAHNSLTLPEFFEHRFGDQKGRIRFISALTILVFFTLYISSGLYSGAILFQHMLGISKMHALMIGSFIIIFYTFVGGFLAVSWTDFFQGCLMLCALLLVPTIIFIDPAYTLEQLNPKMLEAFPQEVTFIGITASLAWGLGYFGQPHILSRFMAIESVEAIPLSRRIAIVWQVFALGGAIAVGLAGAMFYRGAPLHNPETVFLYLSNALFSPWIAGLLIAAILSAIMSTIDSQLLVCTSVLTEDMYKKWLRPQASQSELIMISRLGIVLVSFCAILHSTRADASILSLVEQAWAGFGASFGSVILLSLFWRAYTCEGAIASMVSGAVTVIVWQNMKHLGGIFQIYEIIPGFIVAFVMGAIVSKIYPLQSTDPILQDFDAFKNQL